MASVHEVEIASNISYGMQRMRGGADEEELKDILHDSDEEKTKKPAPVEKARREGRASFLEQPTLTKKENIFKYTKMSVLVLIMLISIALLAQTKEDESDFKQVAIATNDHKLILIVPTTNVSLKEIGVTLMGPFLPQETLREDKNNPALFIFISSGANLGSQTNISKTYEILLVQPNKFDVVVSNMRIHHFYLKPHEDADVYLNLLPKNVDKDLGVALDIDVTPVDTEKGIIYGALVLFFLYFMIVTELVDRTFASLVAAALSLGMLALFDSRPTGNQIMSWIDVETLVLLVGMMILVAILAESGIFDYVAVFAFKVAKGRPWPLINCLCFFTASLATFLDSVTMMLLATPVTIRLCEVLSLDPVPVLICMVIFANVGAAMTPVGDPPNVIISLNPFIAASDVNFGVFILHMFPGVVLALIQCYIHVRILYRKPESLEFEETDELTDLRQEMAVWERTAAAISPYSQDEDIAREALNDKIEALKKKIADTEEKGVAKKQKPSFEETLDQLTAQYPLRDKALLIKAGITFIFILILFLGHSVPGLSHISLGWSALIGAFLLIILADKRDLKIILVRVEWSTLLFFAALFVVMESLATLGLIDLIGKFVINMILSVDQEFRLLLAIVIVLWVSAVASAFLDNIPVTTMMVKIIITLSQDPVLKLPLHPLVWALAFGACFGGNGTLIGASANVVTAGVSEQHGYKITFLRFFIVCFPIMLGSITVTTVYLLIAHVAFKWHD